MTTKVAGVRHPPMSRRTLAILTLFAAFAIVVAAVAYLTLRPGRQLRGTDLGGVPAPGFRLTNADGKPVALDDLRGRVVVLTFLYTHCPDQCPLIAEHLRMAAEQMPGSMKDVAFVAISLDPANDTPDAVNAFLKTHRVSGYLDYLTGSQAQLEPVWSSYYVFAQPDASNPNVVGHSSRIVLIDRAGRQRVNLDPDFDPGDLAYDVQTLVAE